MANNDDEKKNEFPVAFQDMMNNANDFIPINQKDESHPHVLVRWYGLTNFVVLTPARNYLNSESKLKVLLSSFTIALNNIGW